MVMASSVEIFWNLMRSVWKRLSYLPDPRLCSRHSHTRPVPVSNAEHRGTQANPLLSRALLPTYASTYPEDKMQAFWVGKVIAVDAGEGKVNLQRWYTGTVDNLNLDKAAPHYRIWTGHGPKTEWIEITRVLEVFDLTPKGSCVSKGNMRKIENALKLVAAMQSNSGVAPDVAVGRDVYENPGQGQEQDLMDEADSQNVQKKNESILKCV